MAFLFNPFHGQIGRGHWWMLQAAILVFTLAGLFLTALLFANSSVAQGARTTGEAAMFAIILVAVLYMNFSTCLNRLRDSGRSGLWYISFLLPYGGTPMMIYFCGIEAGDGGSYSASTRASAKPRDAFVERARMAAQGGVDRHLAGTARQGLGRR